MSPVLNPARQPSPTGKFGHDPDRGLVDGTQLHIVSWPLGQGVRLLGGHEAPLWLALLDGDDGSAPVTRRHRTGVAR